MVFKKNDQVTYGIHGVCNIIDIEQRVVDRKIIEFYVLEPVHQSGTRFYVPTQNENAVAKLRPIITKDELDLLLIQEDATANAWIDDENQRKQRYRDLITSGDRAQLLRMVHSLHTKKQELLTSGRKFHLCDENFLRDAQNLLGSEFSVVLNVDQNIVVDYVKEKMNLV